MTAPAAGSNRSRGLAFRDSVLLYLHESGHTQAKRPDRTAKKLSQALLEDPGDITGLPWAVAVRSSQALDLSTVLNLAQMSALHNEVELYAAVLSRRGHPIESAYVVMTLASFTQVLDGTTQADA